MRFKINILAHTIHVYGRALTGAERARKLFRERRKSGNCVQCNRKVQQKNVRNGKAMLYRKCKRCRKMENEAARVRSFSNHFDKEFDALKNGFAANAARLK